MERRVGESERHDDEHQQLAEALDDLPEQFRELLEHTPVVVSRRGHEHRAYAMTGPE